MKLTPQREKFAAELAKGKTQSDAYRIAYPTCLKWPDKTIHSKASALARDGRVKARVSALLAPALRNLDVTVERVLQERARLAFFDPRRLLNDDGSPKGLHELDDDTAAAIAGMDTATERSRSKGADEDVDESTHIRKYKLADKSASLTALEKYLGMYQEEDRKGGVLNIQINLA